MDLWIRSQSRTLLEKANSIKIAHYTENQKVLNSIVVNNDYVFGEYETQERALEVLDEIDEFVDLFNRKGFGNVLSDDGVHPKHTIYEMPLE